MPTKRIPSVTVYQRSEAAYSVRWREAGKQHEERGYTSRLDAEQRADAIRRRFRRGVPGSRGSLTVGNLVEAWWDEYALLRLAQGSRETSSTAIRLVIASLFDEVAEDVTTARLHAWVLRLEATGVTPSAINNALTTLSSVFQRAVERGDIESNPVRGVKRVTAPRRLPTIPTLTDIRYLEATAPSEQALLMLRVSTLTGVRQSELFALSWEQVDAAHIIVDRALDRDRSMKLTKTNNPRRVPLPKSLAADLAERRTRGLVFPNESGQPILRSNFVRRVWVPWRRAAAWQAATEGGEWKRLPDLQWRHLRHYYASRLSSVGATMLQCSRWMGHTTIRTTMDRYGFLFDEDETSVMDALDG